MRACYRGPALHLLGIGRTQVLVIRMQIESNDDSVRQAALVITVVVKSKLRIMLSHETKTVPAALANPQDSNKQMLWRTQSTCSDMCDGACKV